MVEVQQRHREAALRALDLPPDTFEREDGSTSGRFMLRVVEGVAAEFARFEGQIMAVVSDALVTPA